jgi:8-oxo-dGTP diphosphatase
MDEREFLATYDPTAFERPSVTVDVVLLAISEHGHLQTLLTQRGDHPFKGAWALPGGFLRLTESLDAAARRVLRQKAGAKNVYLEQLYTFGDVDRDPRTRVLTVAYYALVPAGRMELALAAARSEDLSAQVANLDVPWSGETGGPVVVYDNNGTEITLAFDHAAIIGAAIKRIRGKLDYAPIGFELLPELFTLFELQQIHEAVLGRKVNKDSFRRKMLASKLIEHTGERQTAVGHRPGALYRFRKGANHG